MEDHAMEYVKVRYELLTGRSECGTLAVPFKYLKADLIFQQFYLIPEEVS